MTQSRHSRMLSLTCVPASSSSPSSSSAHSHPSKSKASAPSTNTMHKYSAFLFLLVVIAQLLSSVQARVVIEPTPHGDVGLMSSESKFFNCKLEGGQKGETVTWIDPHGNPINGDPNNRIYVTVKKNMVKLELKSPNKQDNGEYKCVSRKNNQETGTQKFKLHVLHPTTVSGQSNFQKSEGNRVEMECLVMADSDATVEFTWTFGQVDLSQEPQKYRINTRRERANKDGEVRMVSKLEINNVSKEHDGKYTCLVDTSNRFLSDEKELRITLHVQYKPRFDEKTPKFIWISEEAVQQGGPLSVNISCIVSADPVAKINWFASNGIQVTSQPRLQPGHSVRTTIADNENMSVLTLHYRSIDEIKNTRLGNGGRNNDRGRYTCKADNLHGIASNTFEIKVGRIPDAPKIVTIDYSEGAIILSLNESNVEPPVDIYRLEISDEQAHLFNKSASGHGPGNNTYTIELNLPRGEHKVNIFAHNPVGWSENLHSNYLLNVVSGTRALTGSWIAMLFLLVGGQIAMEGHMARFFMGSLLRI